MTTPFDTADALPRPPTPGDVLRKISYRTCPGSDLHLKVVLQNGTTIDDGVPEDAWWVVRCSGVPDRYTRLTRGRHSLRQLLLRYGFMDGKGCVHNRHAVAHFDASLDAPDYAAEVERLHAAVPDSLWDSTGVPQFYHDSGVCWFMTFCWTSFACPQMRALITSHLPDDDFRRLCERCLYDRDTAQALRNRIWNEYNVGDDITRPPREDGCNGATEWCTWAAALGIPVLRYRLAQGVLRKMPPTCTNHGRPKKTFTLREPVGREPHVLILRYNEVNHAVRHPVARRVRVGRYRYRLVGMYLGQRKCGHQIGASAFGPSWRTWGLGDADLHKDGIGPIFFHFGGARWRREWWDAWLHLVHLTHYGPGYADKCNLSPHNPKDDCYDAKCALQGHGLNNVDVVYYSDGS